MTDWSSTPVALVPVGLLWPVLRVWPVFIAKKVRWLPPGQLTVMGNGALSGAGSPLAVRAGPKEMRGRPPLAFSACTLRGIIASLGSGRMVISAGKTVNPEAEPDTKIVSDSSLRKTLSTGAVRLKVTAEEEVVPEGMVAVTELGAAVKSEAEAVPGETVSGMSRSRPRELVVPEGRETVTETEWAAARSSTVVCTPAALLVSTCTVATASGSAMVMVSGSGTCRLAPGAPVILMVSSSSTRVSDLTVSSKERIT